MSRMAEFGFYLSRRFATTKAKRRQWPYVPGKYVVSDPRAPVAVCTLGSVELASAVADSPPPGLCITGKVETENIGIEKIIKNVLSNSAIRILLCVGAEPPKHLTGATLEALFKNGIDEQRRIPGSPGMRPQLPNTSAEEVAAFRAQVEPHFMINCMDVAEIHAKIEELASQAPKSVSLSASNVSDGSAYPSVEYVVAEGEDPQRIKLDKSGYFVVNIEGNAVILVEHYSYKEKLLRVIEGRDARSLYLTLVRNNWVSKLDHACYLGKELTKAELSIRHGFPYTQDGA